MLIRPQSCIDLLGWDELPGLVLVLDHCRELRPVLGQPVHRIRWVDAASERIPGRIFERFLPQPRGGIVDQLMQTLIARMRLESVGNPGAGPALPGQVQKALPVSRDKPWRCVELECQGIVGRVRDGTASNAAAAQNEGRVAPLAQFAYVCAQRAGMVG